MKFHSAKMALWLLAIFGGISSSSIYVDNLDYKYSYFFEFSETKQESFTFLEGSNLFEYEEDDSCCWLFTMASALGKSSSNFAQTYHSRNYERQLSGNSPRSPPAYNFS
jgi:hypothetical protein